MVMVTHPVRGYGSPNKYVQGKGLLHSLTEYTGRFGEKVIALVDSFFFEEYEVILNNLYKKAGYEINVVRFNGEVTENEIKRVTDIANLEHAEVIVGIGGGKTLDVAKGVAADAKLSLIIMPTTASTDAPCSALSVIYKENGQHSDARWYDRNPDLVLVDLDIVINAPVRYLVSGMADALATYYEARANEWSDSSNYIFMNKDGSGCRRTRLAMIIAKSCYRILMEDGLKAKQAAESKICTKAFEDVVEVNTLLSGLGFENTGVAGAHAIANGLTALKESHKSLHGEKVGFGIICQLIMENRPLSEIEEVVNFCLKIGLPLTLESLGIEPTEENISIIAQNSTKSNLLCEPILVTEDLIYDTIIQANEYVKSFEIS
ncbi:glycerol dehydrogenase [Peribacillus huizhouensis]|uniref:Glycerol dehydrogenase n=2 Tax=Peribacillus huizhouensis TaxID=1501239 RepID=A0ABR6CSC9_9BACI|nr:glycerol dehydrogenase [Peribacillus huizhouensis]